MRHHLESRLGTKIDNGSAIVEWLVVWTADILSKYVVHENGRAAYEMATQHVVRHKVIGVAENVHFQFKVQRENMNACGNEKSGVGWFVGIVNRNNEYCIATTDGIISCSTVRRLPDNEAYDKKCIDESDVEYTDDVKSASRTAPIAARFTPLSILATFVPRAAYLKPKDFMTRGYTGTCKGCEYLAAGIGSRKNHSTECRLRMEELLADDQEEQQRLRKAIERK